MSKYYKGRFGIGLYQKIRRAGDTDLCVALFDSAQEFARFLGKPIKKAYDTLHLCFENKQKSIKVKNEFYDLEFVDMLEE